MASERIVTPDATARAVEWCPLLSQRLRQARTSRDLTLRNLAGRIGVSASLISQIETGKVQPSVNTLYALANELELSLDELLFPEERTPAPQPPPTQPQVSRPSGRNVVTLNEGVRWERLSHERPGFDFLEIVYEPGAESGPPGARHRHAGREWGYVVTGTLHIEFGDEHYVLEAGDSISFDSGTPHRLSNPGRETMRGIWFVAGRGATPPFPT